MPPLVILKIIGGLCVISLIFFWRRKKKQKATYPHWHTTLLKDKSTQVSIPDDLKKYYHIEEFSHGASIQYPTTYLWANIYYVTNSQGNSFYIEQSSKEKPEKLERGKMIRAELYFPGILCEPDAVDESVYFADSGYALGNLEVENNLLILEIIAKRDGRDRWYFEFLGEQIFIKKSAEKMLKEGKQYVAVWQFRHREVATPVLEMNVLDKDISTRYLQTLCVNGEFGTSVVKNNRDTREYITELASFLGMEKCENFETIKNTIRMRSFYAERDKNIITQYLRKIIRQNPLYTLEINDFITMLQRSHFQTFRINIRDALQIKNGAYFKNSGYIEVLINQRNVTTQFEGSTESRDMYVSYINLDVFQGLIHTDLYHARGQSLEEKNVIFWTGIGTFGDDPTFFWDSIQKENAVFIPNTFWYLRSFNNVTIQTGSGFFVNKADYINEIQRIINIFTNNPKYDPKVVWKHPSKKWLKRNIIVPAEQEGKTLTLEQAKEIAKDWHFGGVR